MLEYCNGCQSYGRVYYGNCFVMVTSNLTNDSLPTISQTCSSNEEAIMLEYAMAVSLMAGFIMVSILSW